MVVVGRGFMVGLPMTVAKSGDRDPDLEAALAILTLRDYVILSIYCMALLALVMTKLQMLYV